MVTGNHQRIEERDGAFLHRLRAATAAQHARVEGLPISRILMDEQVTIANYAVYLSCMKQLIAFCDDAVRPLVGEIVPQISFRRSLSNISADLLFLEKRGAHPQTVKPLQRREIPDRAFALGFAYVIEGSMLGGRVIMKHAAPRLSLSETRGASFFAGHGAETAAKWKQFLDALMEYVAKHGCGSRVIQGAIAGFDTVFTHFYENSQDLNED